MIEGIQAKHRLTFDNVLRTLTCSCGWSASNIAKPLISLAEHQKTTSTLPHELFTLESPTYWTVRCTCGWVAHAQKITVVLEKHQRKVAKLPKGAKNRYR